MSTVLDEMALDRLLRLFVRRDADGARAYSADDVRAFLPVLVLSAGEALELSPPLLEVMQRFCARLGLTTAMAPDEVAARVRAHYEEHPPHPQLLADLKGVVREELLRKDAAAGEQAAKAMGQAVAKTPVGHGAAPEGSTRASPLARFALDPKGAAKSEDE
jgi:hypothetical protein